MRICIISTRTPNIHVAHKSVCVCVYLQYAYIPLPRFSTVLSLPFPSACLTICVELSHLAIPFVVLCLSAQSLSLQFSFMMSFTATVVSCGSLLYGGFCPIGYRCCRTSQYRRHGSRHLKCCRCDLFDIFVP